MKTSLLIALILGATVAPLVNAKEAELGKGKRIIITKSDFDIEMERVPKEKQYEFLADPSRIERSLATIARTKTYAAIAKDKGLTNSDEFKQRMKSEEEKILARMLINKIAAEVKVPDLSKRALELYVANPALSTEPEQIRASHIMIKTQGRSHEDAVAKLQAIREEVMKDPSKFDDIAAEKSEDDTAKQNRGDMGLLPRGRLTPAVEEVLFAIKKTGEVSEIIQGPVGYHIVQIKEIVPSRRKPFTEVQAEFLAKAERAFVEAEVFKQQEAWLKAEDMKFDAKALESLVSRFEPNSVVPAKAEPAANVKK